MSQSKLITYIVRSMISITTISYLIAVPIGKKSEVNKEKESLDEININPELREYWKKLQISKTAFKNESLAFETADVSSAVSIFD